MEGAGESGAPQPGSPPVAGTVAVGRSFGAAAEMGGTPLPLAPRRVPTAPPRDVWMRVTLYVMVLGAVLTVVYAWFVFHPGMLLSAPAAGLASFQRVGVPLLALAAVIGVLVLERAAVLGAGLMLVATAVGLAGGAGWLVPGTVLGCIWAVRRHAAARITVGYLLLVPGIASSYYGLVGVIAWSSGMPVRGLLPSLPPPASLQEALQPLLLLPLALVGAWLLVRPLAANRPE